MSLPASQPPAGALLQKLTLTALGLALGWTALLGVSLWRSWRANRLEAESFARAEADAAYEKDLAYRRWVALQGGVYVPPSTSTPPNPYLAPLSERDVTTTQGMALTLVNPAYMTRMVHELGSERYAIKGHLTSLNPINPANTPDPWEAAALRSFEHGAKRIVEVVALNGQPVLRLMHPFATEANCLKCHAAAGYTVGDIRGGISTTVPLAPYYAQAAHEDRADLIHHGILLLLGLAGIELGRRRLGRALVDREKTNRALRESESRIRQLIEQLPLFAVTCTLEGAIAYCNPALLALVGRRHEDTVGRNLFELLIPHEHRTAATQQFQQFLAQRRPGTNSIGHLAAHDGQPRLVSWIHTLVTDERGEPVGVTSLGEDITARNAEDLRLRLLSRAVEQGPSIVVITDRQARIEYVNARFTEVTGYTAAEVLGQNPRLLSAGETPPALYHDLWTTLLAGRDWRGLFHNRRKNGEHFWEEAHISPVRDDSGAIVRFIALNEDITAARHAKQALAESEQRFRTLVESAPVAVIVHSDHRCLYANTAARRLFGYDEHTVLDGLDIRVHVQAASLPVVAEREQRAATGKGNPPVELQLRRLDGVQLACETIAVGITYNGRPATLALIVDITERHQMLAALEESEARYRTLVEAAPVAIFSLAAGRFVYANPAAARVFGFGQPAELLGDSIWPRIHADSLAALTDVITRAEGTATGAEAPRAELSFVRRDRSPVLCAATAVPLIVGNQSAVLFLAIDITERKRLEDALRENNARIRETLESTNAGYFLLDRHDRLRHANSALLHFFRLPSLEAVRDRPLLEFIPEAERAAATDFLRRLAGGEEFVGGEFRTRRDDGTVAHYSFTAHLVREAGELAGCEGFVLDTTDAHASEERYQMLFEQLLDGFALSEIIYDPAGRPTDYRFLALNPAFETLIGRPAAAIVGHRARELFPALDEKWVARYGRVALTGEPLRLEDYAADIGRHIEVVAFRPSPGRVATLVRDITQKRQLEQQLQQAQKMEAVGQLAGGVAHDYNNILVAILMNLSLLRSDTNLRPETIESLGELEHEAKRAAALTRQLLVFSRREAVRAVLVDFNEQLDNMLKMLRRLLGEHIAIDTDITPDLPLLLADPGMLDQVVMNLCVNARDAMPAGGHIHLATTAITLRQADIATHPGGRPGEFLRFSVRDTGCGMDAATRERIFEPFFTTKEAGKGTGLGLATVFGIVRRHEGWIEVESALGQGSTFFIFLPFAPPETTVPAASTAHPSAPVTSGAETILLVEDDAVARQTMSLTLRRDGYEIIEAANVADALALWRQNRHRIAALITDVVMPGGHSGLELANSLGTEDPALSIIIISGYSDDAARHAPIVAGATYLAKPFDYETLTQALRASIERHRT